MRSFAVKGLAILIAAVACTPPRRPNDVPSAPPRGQVAPAEGGSGIQSANVDLSVRPQDDLFGYANGRWLREVAIPADRSRYGVDSMMLERSLLQQRDLLAAARIAGDADARKAGDFYASFMDEARIEAAGVAPLLAELQRVTALQRPRDVGQLMAHFGRIGVSSPLEVYVQRDAAASGSYALWLTQSGLGLPDRDYYLDSQPRLVEMRAKYRAHVAAMLRLLGDGDPESRARNVVQLEADLARIQWSALDRRDPKKTYNPRTVDELKMLAPDIDWDGYLAAAGLRAPPPSMIVRQPDYVVALAGLVKDRPLGVWKDYLRFRLLSSSAAYLPRSFVDEDFAFDEGVLHGTQRASERWKRGCALVDRLMGDASGKLYVARYFPRESRARVEALVGNLLKAYAASITHLEWLSPPTRVEALAKLRKITVHVGHPDRWRDYGELEISATDLLGNVLRANELESDRQMAKLGRAIDRAEWSMTATTVDAAYDPTLHAIELPAGVLQPPLYDPMADDAYNYGSTGATIGHEISHAFDNRGSQYDGDGNLRDWWTSEDRASFATRTDKLVKEFDAFEPVPGFHVNGALTLSENIADLAGLEIAYEAYSASLGGKTPRTIDGMTGEQRFFLGYAQSYLGKRREGLLIAQLKSNPHAPERERVNGIVKHLAAFYDAFHVAPNDGMYLPAADRVTLW